MEKLFLGKPTQAIEDHIKQRGKLVIFLTNGKYVTFSKEELGDNLCNGFQLNTAHWTSDINIEPMKSKIAEVSGTTSKSCIRKVIDNGDILKYLNFSAFYSCSNLESIILPSVLDTNKNAFNACRKLKNIYLPKLQFELKYHEHQHTFSDCSSLEKISLPNMIDFRQAYNCFSSCSKLKWVNLRNVKTISYNNSDIFNSCTSLKMLSFPKCQSIVPYASSAVYFSFNAPSLEILSMPILSVIQTNGAVFSKEVSCKKALLGQIPIATIKAKNAWGLPAGCEVIGKDGRYVV